METFSTSQTRAELVTILTETFVCEEYDLRRYWRNVATFLTRHEGLTVELLEGGLVLITMLEACAMVMTGGARWLPSPLRQRVIVHRIRHLPRYLHPSLTEQQKFQELRRLLSTIVAVAGDDGRFAHLFAQYTEIPILTGTDEDEGEPALV